MSLQSIREQRGMTRRELAQRSGVNFRSIQDYEQGHKRLSSASGETLLRLASALGCQIEELLWEATDAESSELLPENDIAIETLLAQRFYCEKYQTYGRWLVGDGRICIYFVYDGIPHRIPFRAIITERLLFWLKQAAVLLMEAALDDIVMLPKMEALMEQVRKRDSFSESLTQSDP